MTTAVPESRATAGVDRPWAGATNDRQATGCDVDGSVLPRSETDEVRDRFSRCDHFKSARSIAHQSRDKPKWIVQGLIRANASNTIIGPPGVGKSVFSDGLGAALASEEVEWCGYALDYSGPVAYLTGDPGEDADTSERIDGLNALTSGRVGVLAVDKARVTQRAYWEELRGDLLSAGVGVLFVDNAYSVATADTDHDKPQGARPFLEYLDIFIRAGVAVVLIQHTAKGNAKRMKDGAGSQAYSAWTRNAVRITQHSAGKMNVEVVKENRETAPDAVLAMSVADGVPRLSRTSDAPHAGQPTSSGGAKRTRGEATLEQRAEMAGHYRGRLAGQSNSRAAQALHQEYGVKYGLSEQYIRTGLGYPKGTAGWLRASIEALVSA